MSDAPASSHPGLISPRNIDKVEYEVKGDLPYPGLPGPGGTIIWWPQGEVYGNFNGGLRPIKHSEVREWVRDGLIVLVRVRAPISSVVETAPSVAEPAKIASKTPSRDGVG